MQYIGNERMVSPKISPNDIAIKKTVVDLIGII